MFALMPCPTCARHVRADETTCPFCRTAVTLDATPRRVVAQRLGRAAIFTFGAALGATSAGCTTTPTANDAGTDAYYGLGGDVYGAPPIDAGWDSGPDGGPDGGLAGAYGGPPIDANVDHD